MQGEILAGMEGKFACIINPPPVSIVSFGTVLRHVSVGRDGVLGEHGGVFLGPIDEHPEVPERRQTPVRGCLKTSDAARRSRTSGEGERR